MDKLTDKSYRSYDYISRYQSFPYYYNSTDKHYIYGTTSQLDDSTSYTLYKTQKNDTFDSISLKFYNSPIFFWVICDFNRIQDPYMTIEEGTYLKIPSLTTIQFT